MSSLDVHADPVEPKAPADRFALHKMRPIEAKPVSFFAADALRESIAKKLAAPPEPELEPVVEESHPEE